MTTNREEAMSTREHAVDPSTLDPEQWVEIEHPATPYRSVSRVKDMADNWPRFRIVRVLHGADECPAEPQWRQVTPEEVREGWLVRLVKGDQALEGRAGKNRTLTVDDIYYDLTWRARHGWTLWTTEPAPDPDACLLERMAEAMSVSAGVDWKGGWSEFWREAMLDKARAALAVVRAEGGESE